MRKRVQLIPLLILIICSGIGLSSGLYFTEVHEVIYPIHVVLMTAIFYTAWFFLGGIRRKPELSLGISLVALLLCFLFLFHVLKPGFCVVLNRISDLIRISTGIDLGTWKNADASYAGLAMCQVTALLTAVTLYLYESRRPLFVTALPSFVVFMLPIMIDGVPYEVCFLSYGMAMIVFLGMGRRGESVRKLLLLLCSTVIVGAFGALLLPWDQVNPVIMTYRDKMMAVTYRNGGSGSITDKKEKEKKEKESQRIDFGQFDEQGDISYNGTVELYLHTKKKFTGQELFLRGFIGRKYENNIWFGDTTHSPSDFYGNAFDKEEELTIENAFDTGIYVPFSVDQKRYEKMLEKRIGISEANQSSIRKSTQKVSDSLKKRIKEEILAENSFVSVNDAVEFVKNYFSSGYKYTLRPGEIRDGENEIEKFLFNRKIGYCTHFASSAVMIFRTMGIPARLAQGYVVSGYRISPDEATSVYDSNAHAWTEIYVDGEGWIPVEVTPQSSRTAVDENAEGGAGAQEEKMTEAPSRTEAPSQTEEPDWTEEPQQVADEISQEKSDEDQDSEEDWEEDGTEEEVGADVKADKKKEDQSTEVPFELRIAVRLILAFCIVLIVTLIIRRLYRGVCYARMKKKLEEENPSRRLLNLNDGMEKVWEKLGIRWIYSSSEKMVVDIFRSTLKFYIFGQTKEVEEMQQRIQNYVFCVYRSRYDEQTLTEKEYEECEDYISELLLAMKNQIQKKSWKKLCRYYPVVRIMKKKRGKKK